MYIEGNQFTLNMIQRISTQFNLNTPMWFMTTQRVEPATDTELLYHASDSFDGLSHGEISDYFDRDLDASRAQMMREIHFRIFEDQVPDYIQSTSDWIACLDLSQCRVIFTNNRTDDCLVHDEITGTVWGGYRLIRENQDEYIRVGIVADSMNSL